MCASCPLSVWSDNLNLSFLIVHLSSPILPSLFPSVHPWVSLFTQSDRVSPTHSCLSMWVNTHTHIYLCIHTGTHTHRLCVCHPFTWLNASILWLQIDHWLDRWMDDPWWSRSLLFLSFTYTHTVTDTHNRGMPKGLWEHKHVFGKYSFFGLFITLPQFPSLSLRQTWAGFCE